MKKLLVTFSIVVTAFLFTGCAAYVQTPALGALYTDVEAPITATSNEVGSKVGRAEASSILGIVATGDASIQEAAQNANISKISHVDYHSTNILGIYATYEVIVYGE